MARDLGIDPSVLHDWVNKARAALVSSTAVPGVDESTPLPAGVEAELRRLRRENAVLREEREILKKAAAFFAMETR